MHDFARFANNLDAANSASYKHENITSSFYWAWNGNSMPQLGLLSSVDLTVPVKE